MAPGDPPPDGGRPRPSLFIPQMTTSDLSHAIRRVDTSLEVGPAAEANAITRVNTLPLTRSGDGGKERGKDAADSDGASWGDLHDAIRRVDTAPRVGATGGQSGANPAAAAAPPASSADPDGTSGGVDSSTDGIDDAATDGGGPAPGAPGATAPGGVAAALRHRPPRPSKTQLEDMRAGMRAARAASVAGGGNGGGCGSGGGGDDGGDGEDGSGGAEGGRDGRIGGRGCVVTMPTPRVVVDVDPAGAVGVVQTPGPGVGSFARAPRPPPSGGAHDPLQSFLE